MSRPAVSVVMPFAGTAEQRDEAIAALHALRVGDGDELILADNSGLPPLDGMPTSVRVISAEAERSPAHARNVGAEHASGEWILFLDADCRAPAGLLDAFFAVPVSDDTGALAGEVAPAGDGATVAARYGVAKSFLGQRAHLAHPYRPRAAAANLMVRRTAFQQVGGFYEGVLAAEDTDFSWRLQQAGWRLELRPRALVEHRYRTTIRALRSQWRGYAAGRAWLARRYEGFEPEPALRRAARRAGSPRRRSGPPGLVRHEPPMKASRTERARHVALDALLGIEELRGLALSNRPRGGRSSAPAQVVLVAERFPARGDPLAEFAGTLEHARVEAVARPEAVAVDIARTLQIHYREDDGIAARAVAMLRLLLRHPLRCVRDRMRARPGQPRLTALAPAVVRLERERGARVHALGSEDVRATAHRLALLSGRRLEG